MAKTVFTYKVDRQGRGIKTRFYVEKDPSGIKGFSTDAEAIEFYEKQHGLRVQQEVTTTLRDRAAEEAAAEAEAAPAKPARAARAAK